MEFLFEAGRRIGQTIGNITAESATYQTAPWGKTDQPDFLNRLVVVETDKKPTEIMQSILQ
ncbi:MAG: 2-amino-4-hydroxy-6-hydroxymethyldihydropteridine diphosphokinase, partial [Bacteroidota bacterium]